MPLTFLDVASSRAAMACDGQSLGELFLENTKLHPMLATKPEKPVSASGKSYPFAPRVPVPADLAPLLAAPSSDVMMPLELYLVSRDSVCHYDAGARDLETLAGAETQVDTSTLFPADVATPLEPVLIIVTGVPLRLTTIDGERGYRTLLLQAGRVAEAMGARAIDRFFDDRVSDLIGVDGVNELPLVILAVTAAGAEAEATG
jgi:hypothetical protein